MKAQRMRKLGRPRTPLAHARIHKITIYQTTLERQITMDLIEQGAEDSGNKMFLNAWNHYMKIAYPDVYEKYLNKKEPKDA